MTKNYFYIALLAFLFFSCKTEKNATEPKGVHPKDYPYIESFHKGLRLKASGRVNEAVAELEKCLNIRQDDDAVYYALSKLELLRGNDLISSNYIQKAASIDPDNTWYIQELAYMYFETKAFEKSVENFEKLVKIEPRNVDWLYGYAEALVQAGQASKAIAALNKTEEQIGTYPDISIQKHRLYLSLNKKTEAEKELLVAKEKFPKDPMLIATLVDFYFQNKQKDKAVTMLKELVAADPSNGRAHLTLADIYQQEGNQEKTYEELKLAFESDDVSIDTKMKILINIHEASYKIDDDLMDLVNIVVTQYPEEAKAHSIHGDYLLRLGDDKGALKAYKNALDFDKTQYPIWNQVLIMEYQNNDFNALYKDSKVCLEYFPSIPTIYLLNGISSNQLKKYNEALDVLSLGKELVVNDKPIEAEIIGQLAEANFGLNEISTGKKQYADAIKLVPGSSLLKNNFAYRLAVKNIDLELAESMIKQALLAGPEQAQYNDTYGLVLFRMGKYKDALELFTKAHGLNATDAIIMEHLGDVNFKLKNSVEALKWWEMAFERNNLNMNLKQKIEDKRYYDEK
jgi:tetratricopeptide (TPR) repeat protein